MNFEHHIPNGALSRYVESFIYFEDHVTTHLIDRFLPDGNVEVVFELFGKPQYIYDNETLSKIQKCESVWASGVRTRPITIPSGSGSRMFVMIFKKGMAHPFFPFPMDEIRDRVVEADLIWPGAIGVLREKIADARNGIERFSLAEDFLLKLLGPRFEPRPFVEYGVSRIIGDPTLTRLTELAGEVGYSKKHFINVFKKDVGVSPKSYLRIMRFQKAVTEIEDRDLDWASIALDCGYYDQAHFINDFKSFSGFTPVDYSRRKNGALNYVPVS
ncbi:MAG: AraC family transcriptional regulator [Acidobacteriota bacterium]|nr:AraC family transcriptional regulator [Acidobacteriota bacterium]MDH3528251.1 AraC family transcriptional regulator [Acidobacteriota bacterium]